MLNYQGQSIICGSFTYQRKHFRITFRSLSLSDNFFLKAFILWIDVKIFSLLHCMVTFKILRCWNISAKYANFLIQDSHRRTSQKWFCFISSKNLSSSCRSLYTQLRSFPLESHLTLMCRSRRLCCESILLHNCSNKRDLTDLVLM